MQKKQNDKWEHPVFMLYYNRDESFENLDKVTEKISGLE